MRSNHDIELVRHVLNHGDIRTTMRYLGVSQKRVKELLIKLIFLYIIIEEDIVFYFNLYPLLLLFLFY